MKTFVNFLPLIAALVCIVYAIFWSVVSIRTGRSVFWQAAILLKLVASAHDLRAQKLEYAELTLFVVLPWIFVVVFSHFVGGFISWPDMALLLSVLLLFLGSWFPLIYARTFIPLIESDYYSEGTKTRNIKAGDYVARSWAEVVSFIGALVAILATIATGAGNYSSEAEKERMAACLGSMSAALHEMSTGKPADGTFEKRQPIANDVARHCGQYRLVRDD